MAGFLVLLLDCNDEMFWVMVLNTQMANNITAKIILIVKSFGNG